MFRNKRIIIFAMLIIAFLLLNNRYHLIEKSFGKTNQNNESLPLNTSLEGVSIFYDTLKHLGYSVKVDAGNLLKKNDGDIYIITENRAAISFDLKEAEDWIKAGGKLIYLTPAYEQYTYADRVETHEDKASLYAVGEGKLLIGDIDLVTNNTLLKNREGAYFVFKCIESLGGDIYFNEHYRFLGGQSPSLYRNLPIHVKFILFQLILTLIGVIFYLGKGFGKPKRIIDEIERDENEYLHASANLYEKCESIDIVYDAFHREFENEFKKTFKRAVLPQDWVDLWTGHGLPHKEEAARVFDHQKENRKAGFSVIKDLDLLTQIMIKRREEFWVKLKQKNL
ncbi:hypothetical protein [Geosporobacter ferrireducens]|uniref:DUF4350 domain-containing protein n=1 Tax=Geosporobacter ferrireducens TaxID=1424294 RepID=A0A1D8GPL8_9FIRM|nr:hypothetical protein [Geosporobacter ferrireducens]AOT72890.1 hypothetical protein Gferi_27035 [Geosporobacter ferrireducens]MTI55295.1 hypothetical protein [Geosporobacter ferrireducens]